MLWFLLMYGNSTPLTMAIWGLSLALLLAASIVVWLVLRVLKRDGTRGRIDATNFVSPVNGSLGELNISLDDAAKLNGYNVASMSNPSVHLGTAIRITPLTYKHSVVEIMQNFREGRVVSIDLSKMNFREASRLVDFCSGLTAMDSGWIFRVTDKVIVLTPLS